MYTTKKNISLTINLSNQRLLGTIITNLHTNLQNKKLLASKIVTIMNKKL